MYLIRISYVTTSSCTISVDVRLAVYLLVGTCRRRKPWVGTEEHLAGTQLALNWLGGGGSIHSVPIHKRNKIEGTPLPISSAPPPVATLLDKIGGYFNLTILAYFNEERVCSAIIMHLVSFHCMVDCQKTSHHAFPRIYWIFFNL